MTIDAAAHTAVWLQPICGFGFAASPSCGQRCQSLGLLQACRQGLLSLGPVAAIPVPQDALPPPYAPSECSRYIAVPKPSFRNGSACWQCCGSCPIRAVWWPQPKTVLTGVGNLISSLCLCLLSMLHLLHETLQTAHHQEAVMHHAAACGFSEVCHSSLVAPGL